MFQTLKKKNTRAYTYFKLNVCNENQKGFVLLVQKAKNSLPLKTNLQVPCLDCVSCTALICSIILSPLTHMHNYVQNIVKN